MAVLIETLWNVKTGGTVEAISLAIAVLIETLWNVKKPPKLSSRIFLFVLIETLWNVKIGHGNLTSKPCSY